MGSIETIQSIYAAFGRGDVPTILEALAPDVTWEYGAVPNEVPWLAPRRGREAVAGFFGALAANTDVEAFRVNDIVGNDRLVVALIEIDLRVKATGRLITERDEPHVWRFDERGRIKSFRHAADTLAHANAVRV
jgi:ketosteroid isomerase-like protein